MSELTLHPIESPIEAAELAVLRRTNTELVAKAASRKARVTELEASIAEFQGKLSTADSTIQELTVGIPLKAMAHEISKDGNTFLEFFKRSYKLEMVNGALALLTVDGRPVMKGDKAVPFEREALIELLTDANHPQAKLFNSLLIVSKASGASGSGNPHTRSSEPKQPSVQFGLR
jgi:hypothetical protein